MSGLLALGKAGKWMIDVDDEEDDSYGVPFSITFNHPALCIQIALNDLSVLKDLLSFLKDGNDRPSEFIVGKMLAGELGLSLVDGALRFKLQNHQREIGTSFPYLLEVLLDPSETPTLIEALDNAVKDLAR